MVINSGFPKTTCTNYDMLISSDCNSERRLEKERRKGRNKGRKEEREGGRKEEGKTGTHCQFLIIMLSFICDFTV